MKFLLMLVLSLGSASVFANNKMSNENFVNAKTKTLSHLDKKMAELTEAKSCVSAATTQDSLKACKQKLHEKRKYMKKYKKTIKSKSS